MEKTDSLRNSAIVKEVGVVEEFIFKYAAKHFNDRSLRSFLKPKGISILKTQHIKVELIHQRLLMQIEEGVYKFKPNALSRFRKIYYSPSPPEPASPQNSEIKIRNNRKRNWLISNFDSKTQYNQIISHFLKEIIGGVFSVALIGWFIIDPTPKLLLGVYVVYLLLKFVFLFVGGNSS